MVRKYRHSKSLVEIKGHQYLLPYFTDFIYMLLNGPSWGKPWIFQLKNGFRNTLFRLKLSSKMKILHIMFMKT